MLRNIQFIPNVDLVIVLNAQVHYQVVSQGMTNGGWELPHLIQSTQFAASSNAPHASVSHGTTRDGLERPRINQLSLSVGFKCVLSAPCQLLDQTQEPLASPGITSGGWEHPPEIQSQQNAASTNVTHASASPGTTRDGSERPLLHQLHLSVDSVNATDAQSDHVILSDL
jgi:hypothetical protein